MLKRERETASQTAAHEAKIRSKERVAHHSPPNKKSTCTRQMGATRNVKICNNKEQALPHLMK